MAYLVFEEQGEFYLLVVAAAVRRHPIFFANLLSGCLLKDAQGRRLDPLDVWQATKDGSWPDFLARYLTPHVPSVVQQALPSGMVAIKRAASRQDGVCTIFQERDAVVWVRKSTLVEAAEQAVAGQPIFPGVAYDIHLRQLAARGDWMAWLQALEYFVETVFMRFALSGDALQGQAIDAIARNAVLDERAGITFFDLEFSNYTAPAKTFMIYRLCLSLVGRRGEYLADSGFTCLYELYCHLCSRFELDPAAYVLDVRREAAFQAWVCVRPSKAVKYFKGLQAFAPRQSIPQRLRRLRYAFRLLVQTTVKR